MEWRRVWCAWSLVGFAALCGVVFAPLSAAIALTPDSPEVKQAIEKGLKYLDSHGAADNRVGAQALVGLAFIKQGAKADHPRVAGAVAAIQKALGGKDPKQVTFDIYSTGLAIIFLVEADPSKYKPEIDCLLTSLQARQKPHGGWGYPERETGDTSMTQYGVLSSWEATQAGFTVPIESIEGVATWLLRTQDPSGGFGYQGNVAKGGGLVQQSDVKLSMTAAGLGSLCISASLLGLTPKVEKREGDVPAALKEIKPRDGDGKNPQPVSRIDAKIIREAENHAMNWLKANYQIDFPGWTHYYLYALERCMSFMELQDPKAEKEPKWYNDGARFLIKTQAEDGSWTSQCGVVPDTAFGILFLLRSTKKSIEKAYSYSGGTLVGGRGLPKDTGLVEVRGGQVVAKPLLGPAEGLLKALENPGADDYDKAMDLLADLPAPDLEALMSKYGDQLRSLVNDKSPDARLAVVRALAKTINLDNVPALIYALSDPDPEVVQAAHEGLQRISRNPASISLSNPFGEEERRMVIEKWKGWYREIRPSAEVDFFY